MTKFKSTPLGGLKKYIWFSNGAFMVPYFCLNKQKAQGPKNMHGAVGLKKQKTEFALTCIQ